MAVFHNLAMIWNTPTVLRVCIIATIGGLIFGYDLGAMPGAFMSMKDEMNTLNETLYKVILGISTLGAMGGAGIGVWTTEKIGRKSSIILADILSIMGSGVTAGASTSGMAVIGRLCSGCGIGIFSTAVPIYICEVSPALTRGSLLSINGFLVTVGQILGILTQSTFGQIPGSWRWLLGLAVVAPTLQLLLMLSVPESPRWLLKKKRIEEARKAFEKIRPTEEVETEIKRVMSAIDKEEADEASNGHGFLRSALRKKSFCRAFYIAALCGITQRLAGLNSIGYFGPRILELSGFPSKFVALRISVITAVVGGIASVLGFITIDRYGRRKSLIFSLTAIFITLLLLSVLGDCFERNKSISHHGCPKSYGVIGVFLLGVYIVFYTPGIGMVPMILTSEIFGLQYRSLGTGLTEMINWAITLAVNNFFLSLTKSLGAAGVLLTNALVSLLGLIAIFFVVPETKALNLEEMAQVLSRGFRAWPLGED